MARQLIRGMASALLAACCCVLSAQQADNAATIHVTSNLTLVNVIVQQDGKRGDGFITGLTRQDFRVLNDGHEVPIESFDSGTGSSAQPITLWLVVQCNLGFPVEWASMFMRGKTKYLVPALQHLGPQDELGVASWCDNGRAQVDQPPTRDVSASIATVDTILSGEVVRGDNRSGELAMQHLIDSIVSATSRERPSRLPVLLFLYGDHSGTYGEEAARIISGLLASSGIVFGLNDEDLHYPNGDFGSGKVFNLVHVYSAATGGQYYSVSHPELLGAALDYILAEVHERYTLGIRPPILDGKVHDLKVELTDPVRHKLSGITLQFRQEYIAGKTGQPGP